MRDNGTGTTLPNTLPAAFLEARRKPLAAPEKASSVE